jgi:soluble lytic murein transglycosylase-like protein
LPPSQKARIPHNHPALDAFASAVEQRYGLPPGLLVAVKNAGERSNTGQVSPAGAKGVMQFIDATRHSYPHNPGDPMESIDAAGRYFADLMRQYQGNAMAAIAAYNGGTAAGKAVMRGEAPPADETRGYLARIAQYMERRFGG